MSCEFQREGIELMQSSKILVFILMAVVLAVAVLSAKANQSLMVTQQSLTSKQMLGKKGSHHEA